MTPEPDDCDVFEIAQELYDVLKECQAALNWMPNRKLCGGSYARSYELASVVDKTLDKFKGRI